MHYSATEKWVIESTNLIPSCICSEIVALPEELTK